MRGMTFPRLRYSCGDCSSFRAGMDLEFSAKLFYALAHSHDSDTGRNHRLPVTGGPWSGNALPLVGDSKHDFVTLLNQPDQSGRASRVAMDVRQTLLRYPEQSRFHAGFKPPDWLHDNDIHLNTAMLHKTTNEPL